MKSKTWKVFRDPIHKDIYLTPDELGIVDTLSFQRLRGIKELGAAYWVYPSALHSRFEHSLGVLYNVKKILYHMKEIHGIDFSEEERRILCFYGLLHDISHIPYGHTLEDERRLFPRHDEDEKRIQFFLDQKDLAQGIEKTGLGERLRKILITGRSNPPFLTEVVSATIGADMMDYLRRDTYFCGLTLDYDDRILRSFMVEKGRLVFNLSKEGMVRSDALSELVHLLHMRYILTERVYFHHAKIAASVILCKAVELAIQEGLKKEDLYCLEDSSFLFYLSQRFQNHPIIPRLVEDFQGRRLFKKAYVLTPKVGKVRQQILAQSYYFNDQSEREKTEAALAKELGVPEWAISIYCPSPKMSLKRADMLVKVDSRHLVALEELDIPEIGSLLEKHKRLWRFYVFIHPQFQDKRKKLAKLSEEFFGEKNEWGSSRLEKEILR